MNRRKFIKLAGMSGIGLTMPSHVRAFINTLGSDSRVDLVEVTGYPPSRITRAAVDVLGGMNKFISEGDIVVVKPNIGYDRLPEQAANTNPEVVAMVVRLCYEAGAKKVKVFDRSRDDPGRCYVQSGIADTARTMGAEVSFVNERKLKTMRIKGVALKKWPVYTEIIEADKVINVPVAKHHVNAGASMSMKNWMGVIGGLRGKLHQNLDQNLVDLSTFIKPTLTILDAVRVLVSNGPHGGSLSDVRTLNTVIAGVDQVAVDAFGATLFGMNGSDLGYVRIAAEAGMGVMDLSRLNMQYIRI